VEKRDNVFFCSQNSGKCRTFISQKEKAHQKHVKIDENNEGIKILCIFLIRVHEKGITVKYVV
jgi:hypothetical protein